MDDKAVERRSLRLRRALKLPAAASVLMIAVLLPAQVRTGRISGKVTDADGRGLPGVRVALTSPQAAALTTVTGATGAYRFMSLDPGGPYDVTAELDGFKKEIRTGVVVHIGSNAEIDLALERGATEDHRAAVARTPVLDMKRTAIGMTMGKDVLRSLPAAGDPWVVFQLAPAVMIDRENVGGNESARQSAFVARGDPGSNGRAGGNDLWLLDGVDVGDPGALGESAVFDDLDVFEEIRITTGGAPDVAFQTGGITLSMATRRGGNTLSLAGRFSLTDASFQSANLTQDLIDRGVAGTSEIRSIKDFGFSAGGPLIMDRLWWWGAYGVQDLFVTTIHGTPAKTLLNNLNFRLNARPFPNNRFEASVRIGGKEEDGLNAAAAKPEGDHGRSKRHWGDPIVLLQDEHAFGDSLFLSLQYSFNDGGFGWVPTTDEGLESPVVYDNANAKYVPFKPGTKASWDSFLADRTASAIQLNANDFIDTFLGFSQEIKIGAEHSRKKAAHHRGVFQDFTINRNYDSLQIDADGDGGRTVAEMSGWQLVDWFREDRDNALVDRSSAYIQDTLVKGDFTIQLGLRFDNQKGSLGAVTHAAVPYQNTSWRMVFGGTADSPSAVSLAMADIVPGVTADAVKAVDNYQWNTWSPRVGLAWDVRGNGKTVVKLGLSQFGNVLWPGAYAQSPSGVGGSARYWWKDGGWTETGGAWGSPNAPDGLVQFDEIFWAYWSGNADTPYRIYRLYDDSGTWTAEALAALVGGNNSDARKAGMYSVDWECKTCLNYRWPTIFFMDNKTRSSPRTREVLLILEREIRPDLAASVNLSYRRYDNFDSSWAYYPEAVFGETDPELAGLVVDATTGPWYEEAGTIPDQVEIGDGVFTSTGGAARRPYYLPVAGYPTVPTEYSLIKKSDSYDEYFGLDIILNKRLSNKWFLNASFTLQDQRSHWGTDFLDPTNRWMSDGKPYGLWGSGGGGKTSVLMYTRWMAKISALYQLPYGFDISGTFQAREGWKIPHSFSIFMNDAPNPGYRWTGPVYTGDVTADSLPAFSNLTLRLEKRIVVGRGRAYLMADCFNVLNAAIPVRAYEASYGAVYLDGGVQYDSWANPTNRAYAEILNPRIFRFGLRFEF